MNQIIKLKHTSNHGTAMWYDYRFRAYPDRTGVTAEAERHIDIHRQTHDHTRHEYNALDTDEDNVGSASRRQKRLTECKDRWPVFEESNPSRGPSNYQHLCSTV